MMALPTSWSITLDAIGVGGHGLGRGHRWGLAHGHTRVSFASASRVWGHRGFLLALHGEWRWGGGLRPPLLLLSHLCSLLSLLLPPPLLLLLFSLSPQLHSDLPLYPCACREPII